MGFPSQLNQQRWLPARNIGTKPIPPFGMCCIDVADGSTFFAVEMDGGRIMYRVQVPDAVTADLEDAALCFVNSAQAILPGRTGRVTQDWPAQVFHDGTDDALHNGEPCGPVAGESYVKSDRGPFVCISHDESYPLANGKLTHQHTVLIAPGNTVIGRESTRLNAGQVIVEAGQPIPMPSPVARTGGRAGNTQGAFSDASGTLGGWAIDIPNGAFEIRRSGVYLLSFSFMVRGPAIDQDADYSDAIYGYEGDTIRIGVQHRPRVDHPFWDNNSTDPPAFQTTGIEAETSHSFDDIAEPGEYDYHTHDTTTPNENYKNVSVSGPIPLFQGDQIYVSNNSQMALTFQHGVFSAVRLGPVQLLTTEGFRNVDNA